MRDFHQDYLLACLQAGVTTLRDEGMFIDSSLEEVAHRKLHYAQPHYPRIVTTGKYFAAPGGYGGMQPISVTSVEEANLKVQELLDVGMNMVKTSLEDGLDPGTYGLRSFHQNCSPPFVTRHTGMEQRFRRMSRRHTTSESWSTQALMTRPTWFTMNCRTISSGI